VAASAYFAAMKVNTGSAALALGLALTITSGCATSAPAPTARVRSSVALDDVRRVVVVSSGESRFAGVEGGKEGGKESARILDEVTKWLPYNYIIGPLAKAVYAGVSWLMDSARTSVPKDVSPGAVVADAFARALQVTGPFNHIAALEREPLGDERRGADAIIRLSVPAWGLVRVREGTANQVASFADVRAQMVLRETGVVVWEHEEDVTHPERLSLETLTRDRALTRQELVDVLERAGRRLASELVYARNGGR
jgi:hypothetical protein